MGDRAETRGVPLAGVVGDGKCNPQGGYEEEDG